MKNLYTKVLQYIVETPERQTEWFGSDRFMWMIFAIFGIGTGLMILLNPI